MVAYDINAGLQNRSGVACSFCALRTVGRADHEFPADCYTAGNHLRHRKGPVECPTFGHKAGAQQID